MAATSKSPCVIPRVLVALVPLLAVLPVAPAAAAATPHAAPTNAVYAPATAPLDPVPSLPSVTDGARPGPEVLYAPAPDAPQLDSTDPRFRVAPLMVSGTEAYDAGEYVYQDYLYDDHGSNAMPVDTTDQTGSNSTPVAGPGSTLSADALSYQAGSISYPTDASYAGNAADLVEYRMALGTDSTAFRFTLDTLRRNDSAIIALALDTDRNAATGTTTLPRDPGAPFPGTDAVLTTWGTGGEVSTFSAAGALVKTTPVDVHTDLRTDQITVTVPRTVLPMTGTVKATLASGLYDASTGGWLKPGMTATATQPGGAGPADPTPSGIFNLGFRFTEPVLTMNTPPDTGQADALAAHTPTTFAHDIDLDAVRAGAVRSTVPTSGLMIRLYPSRIDLGGGFDPAFPEERGQLQPYAVYVPTSGATAHAHPLLLSMHSNGQHYWQYDGTKILSELGEAHDTVVLSPLGRGHNGWYIDSSEDDVFEAWNDVARHVRLDPDRTAVSGYSMGGYGTYRLGGEYPDLFGKAFSVVGPPGKMIWIPPAAPTDGIQTLTNLWLENNRNLPYLNMNQTTDELVPLPGPLTQNIGDPALGTTSFEQLGYRYRWLLFQGGEHYTLAALGYDFPVAAAFLADTSVDRDPAHVTYAAVPGADNVGYGLVHDHAYWVSGVTLADLSAGPGAKGVVDARSEAFGTGDPVSTPEQSAGVMGVGSAGLPYEEVGRTWGPAPATPVANTLDLTMTNLSTTTVQLDRARLTATGTPLTVKATSDRAASLVLRGALPAAATVTRDGTPIAATVADGALSVPISQGAHAYQIRPAAAASTTSTTKTTTATKTTASHRSGSHGSGTRRPTATTVAAPTRSLAATGLASGLPAAGAVALAAGLVLRRRRRLRRR